LDPDGDRPVDRRARISNEMRPGRPLLQSDFFSLGNTRIVVRMNGAGIRIASRYQASVVVEGDNVDVVDPDPLDFDLGFELSTAPLSLDPSPTYLKLGPPISLFALPVTLPPCFFRIGLLLDHTVY
jgi:hypothetical protein